MILTKRAIIKMLSEEPPLVENLIDKEIQIQNNGIDLTIGSIYRQYRRGVIDFDNSQRFIAPRDLLRPEENFYYLRPGAYIIVLGQKINLPKNVVGITKSRSSLTRNSAYIESAVWDAGYSGYGEVLLHVVNQFGIKLYENARICQIIFLETDEDTTGYEGIYQGERDKKNDKNEQKNEYI